MEITRVDLENVKSYERATVTFAPGTNAICGHNAAGKSTILEAIGFALFDTLLTTQDQFVREGEKTASVVVHVVGDDSRPYQVVRKCGSSSQYYVYDAEIGQKLTDGKADTMGWLHQFAGVERSGDLPALFRDAVGVPQGLLTAAFLETTSRRKDIFNPLLRVDEYEEVWRALREPASCLRDDIGAEERHIARLEGEVKRLPAEEDRAADLRIAIARDEAERQDAQRQLDDVEARKTEMEALKSRLVDLERAVAQAAGEVRAREARWQEAAEAVASAERAQAVVADTTEGHQAFRAAEEALDALDGQRKERDRLVGQWQACDKDLALARREIESSDRELGTIAAAEGEMARLQSLAQTQDALEKRLEAARRQTDRADERRRALDERRQQLADLEGRLTAVQEGLNEYRRVELAIEELERDLQASERSRDALTARAAAQEADLARVREQMEVLLNVGTSQARCPICEGPLTPEHRLELLQRNEVQEEELEDALRKLRIEQHQLADARQSLLARLDDHRGRLKTLPRPAEAGRLREQTAALAEAIAGLEEKVKELAGAPARVEKLHAELEELGDPRSQYARAAEAAARRSLIEEELARARGQAEELRAQLGDLDEKLAVYEDLDQRIETERGIREAHAVAHQRYVSHIREARQLDERRRRAAEHSEALAAARAEHIQLVDERDRAAEDYHPQAHQQLQATYDRLRGAIAALEEALRHRRERLEETLNTIDHLRRVQAELIEAQVAYEELQALLSLLETMRQVLREAGPKVTQALVHVISAQAAQLYADIMADHTTRLRWTEEYEILLGSGGRERGFQQLSGGEQMAAALAVRLALLKEVSAIDLAFFDEPTANLDSRRRDNLAEQILKVKGFSQLFVISHDDTFEQDTDHVVRVVKEHGRSRLIGE